MLCGSGSRTNDELGHSRTNANVTKPIVLLYSENKSELSDFEYLERHLEVEDPLCIPSQCHPTRNFQQQCSIHVSPEFLKWRRLSCKEAAFYNFGQVIATFAVRIWERSAQVLLPLSEGFPFVCPRIPHEYTSRSWEIQKASAKH